MMLVGLEVQSFEEAVVNRLFPALAQSRAYIDFAIREQTRTQLAIGRQTQTVAFAAEMTR